MKYIKGVSYMHTQYDFPVKCKNKFTIRSSVYWVTEVVAPVITQQPVEPVSTQTDDPQKYTMQYMVDTVLTEKSLILGQDYVVLHIVKNKHYISSIVCQLLSWRTKN